MPVKAKHIKDLPLKRVLDGSESLLVQDLNGTQQAPLGTIVDEIKQNSQEKIREIESELNQTNAQLSTKAFEADLLIERKRIDSILALPGGTTALDAELIDIRTGQDGVVYNSAGSAVRTQFKYVNQNIEGVYDNIAKSISELKLDFVNRAVNNQGNVEGENNTRITTLQLINVSNDKALKIEIASGYMYALFTFSYRGVFEKVDYNLTSSISYLSGNKTYRILLTKIDNKQPITITEAQQALKVTTLYFNPQNEVGVKYTENNYINYNDGKIYPYANYYCSDYLVVKNVKRGLLDGVSFNNESNLSGIAFYDSNKTYISGIQMPRTNYLAFEVPKNAYYVRLTTKSNTTKCYFINDGTKEVEESPVKYNGKEIMAFDNILCIGDSLTHGAFDYADNGGGITGRNGKYSYPSYLAKITGCQVDNWGISGATSKSWYDEKIKISKWEGYDCALINLGANDLARNDMTATLSKEYVQKIIDKLKEDNRGIKIFLMTIVPAYYNKDKSWYEQINQTRQELVEANDNCYFIDLTKYSETGESVYHYGHLTALGYLKEAEEIVAYVSKVMSDNLDEFKWIQHINTNHAVL